MKSFVSWSGGKDCMYALHLFLKDKNNEAACLLNMCNANDGKSGSHGLSSKLIKAQAAAMQVPVVQQPIEEGDYERSFKKAIAGLKTQGVDSGVFGDIYLQAHRDWIERVCLEMGISPVFPLWQMDTENVIRNFIDDGFQSVVVAVRKEILPESFLGRYIDSTFLNDILTFQEADPCGENGEYHTFVFNGPLFDQAVSFSRKGVNEDDKHWFLEIAH